MMKILLFVILIVSEKNVFVFRCFHLRLYNLDAVIEQEMSMSGASMFWFDTLRDCRLDQSLSLPFDRYRLSDEHRTGRGLSISFDFGEDLSHEFVVYSSRNNMKVEDLALSCYYVFLFKLIHGESDLCIGMNTHGRYKEELMSVIGMFVNIIPLRCQLNPHWSFSQLINCVEEMFSNCMKYDYFPLQRILAQHPNVSKAAFLDTSFEFQTNEINNQNKNEIFLGNNRLNLVPFSINISENEIMSKFDFTFIIQHDLNNNQLSCTINVSLDLFNLETMNKISQRFHSILKQLFLSTNNQRNQSIVDLSLILSDEIQLIQSMNNTQILFPSSTSIHYEFIHQVIKHPQKLSLELDEQSLTYAELFFYVQLLSLNLRNQYQIIQGDIISQCVERSLTMVSSKHKSISIREFFNLFLLLLFTQVIGIMTIEMLGAVYCPLSPRDPKYRLQTLLEQTQSHLVLVHSLTNNKFNDNIISFNIESILINNNNHFYEQINLQQLTIIDQTPDDIAYIIFTSGSTGTPKAVSNHTFIIIIIVI